MKYDTREKNACIRLVIRRFTVSTYKGCSQEEEDAEESHCGTVDQHSHNQVLMSVRVLN